VFRTGTHRPIFDYATPLIHSAGRSSEKAFEFAAVLITSLQDLVRIIQIKHRIQF